MIRDRLVSGIQNDRIREKLLSKKDFTLTKAVQLLKSSEVTQLQAQEMATPEVNTVQAITAPLIKSYYEKKMNKQEDFISHADIVAGSTNLGKMTSSRQSMLHMQQKGTLSTQYKSAKAHHIDDE